MLPEADKFDWDDIFYHLCNYKEAGIHRWQMAWILEKLIFGDNLGDVVLHQLDLHTISAVLVVYDKTAMELAEEFVKAVNQCDLLHERIVRVTSIDD